MSHMFQRQHKNTGNAGMLWKHHFGFVWSSKFGKMNAAIYKRKLFHLDIIPFVGSIKWSFP